MNTRLMIFPCKDKKETRLISIPDDYEEHEVFRHVVGLIAQIEEENPSYGWEDIMTTLEEHGFEQVEFILGPELEYK